MNMMSEVQLVMTYHDQDPRIFQTKQDVPNTFVDLFVKQLPG